MIRVLVVDDQTLIRRAVVDILAGAAGFEVVGEAVDGRDAVEKAQTLVPDVVVMDIRMPTMDGIDATVAICANPALSDTRVLILTTFEEDEFLFSALRAGASGFIGKGSEPEDIIRAVQSVHGGDALLSPIATRALIAKYLQPTRTEAATAAAVASVKHLTEREREVLLLVARGRSNLEIAADLFISPHTAKTHVNRVMTKAAAHDRAQLVILAYESGLLIPGVS
ncbi:response regulator [Microbacterium sp. ZW T5_45]|uniref:response regulator transcription factor n=1 Tax=Microbacterium sp. ZW T5_45 TaxID=3378080 RepID=UPI0038546BAC